MRFFLVVVFVLVVGAAAGAYGWLNGPLEQTTDTVDLSIEPGSNGREIAQSVADAGIAVHPDLLYLWFRVSGQSRQIKAGSYELEQGLSPRALLRKLVRGEESLRALTLVEGWTFRQVRAALASDENWSAVRRPCAA